MSSVLQDARRDGVQSIARAATLLRALGDAPAGLTLGELADAVGLPKSTTHRLVAALSDEQLLGAAANRRIVLGEGLARLAAAAAPPLAERLRPLLDDLAAELGEAADLAVLDDGEMRFLAQAPAAHRLSAVSAVGVRFPLHCTANGKAVLAGIGRERAEALLPARLPRMTPNTITTRAALMRSLEEVRRTGVAYDREEHTLGVFAVGAAVLAPSGPVAAISVPVPTARLRGAESRYGARVHAAARRASAILAGGDLQESSPWSSTS